MGKGLGEGAFGSVRIVKRKADGLTYALKSVKITSLEQRDRENALNEIRLLYLLNHPNVIGYKDSFYDDESKTINIVMEFADGGDIASKIRKNRDNNLAFKESTIWSITIQILQGVNFLHKNNVIHRDLKCANIFLTAKGIVKIGDLNVSKLKKSRYAQTQTGTPYYIAPEIWLDKPYDAKADVWSIGCIIYEMCTSQPPFNGTNFKNLSDNILKGIYKPIPSSFSPELSKIISLLLTTAPEKRPSCEELLQNPIIIKKMQSSETVLPENNPKGSIDLIKTIKLPKNLKDINKALPKKKYRQREEEMMGHDQFELTKKAGGLNFQNEVKPVIKDSGGKKYNPVEFINNHIKNPNNNPNNLGGNHQHQPVKILIKEDKNSESVHRGPNANAAYNYQEMIKQNEKLVEKQKKIVSNEKFVEQQKALVRQRRAEEYINNIRKKEKAGNLLARPPSAHNQQPAALRNKILPSGSHQPPKAPVIITKSDSASSKGKPESIKDIYKKDSAKKSGNGKVIIQKIDYKKNNKAPSSGSSSSNKKVYVRPASSKNRPSEAGKGFKKPVFNK